MPVIVLTSAHGSPGVTTTALGLILCWGGDSLLVDADRQPAQTIEAGFLHGSPALGRGLTGIARAHREQRSLEAELRISCVELTADSVSRRLLPGFAHPGAAGLFLPVWEPLMAMLQERSAAGECVVIDAGRIGDGLPPGLVAGADQVLVCTRSSLRDLAALRLHLPLVRSQIDQFNPRVGSGLVVIGANQPYSAAEISAQFGVEVWAALPWDPAGAAVWSDGEPRRRGRTRAGLERGVRALAAEIEHRTRRTEVRAPAGWRS